TSPHESETKRRSLAARRPDGESMTMSDRPAQRSTSDPKHTPEDALEKVKLKSLKADLREELARCDTELADLKRDQTLSAGRRELLTEHCNYRRESASDKLRLLDSQAEIKSARFWAGVSKAWAESPDAIKREATHIRRRRAGMAFGPVSGNQYHRSKEQTTTPEQEALHKLKSEAAKAAGILSRLETEISESQRRALDRSRMDTEWERLLGTQTESPNTVLEAGQEVPEYDPVKKFDNRLTFAVAQQGDARLDDGSASKSSNPDFDWQQIDLSLANLMLSNISEEIRKSIREEEHRIDVDNIRNENVLAIPTLRLKMHLRRTGEWAQRIYDAYREVWQRQGKTLSPEFLRAVCARGVRVLVAARTGAVINELETEAVRTRNYPEEWLKATTAEFRREMQRLLAHWERRIEIDAKRQEHDRNALTDATGKYDHTAAKSKNSIVGKNLDR